MLRTGTRDVQGYGDHPALNLSEKAASAEAQRIDPQGEKGGFAQGGHLTAKARQSLPRSDFALPGRGEGPKGAGSGSYPVPDKNHARAALSRASANASPAEQATIRAKVHAKFPAIGKK